jgi:2-C-methyl-D-erythritol 4-phosphate cytidylyltransferase
MYWCVIPAAGAGRRLGGDRPKQYQSLLGMPMLLRTLDRLARHPQVAGLMVVLASDDAYWPGIQHCGDKPVLTCVGGAERADSVLAGLRALPPVVSDRDWVLVHDAARPCVRHDDISRLLALGIRHAVGAVLGAPVRDTLKRRNAAGESAATVSRENLWRAYTPQLFRRGELIEALALALGRADSTAGAVTDDASAIELLGKSPLLVEGSDDNLKVTGTGDLGLAEVILRAQGESAP